MIISPHFALGVLLLYTSCNGHSSMQGKDTKQTSGPMAKGDTVKELGNNIMLVYQDTKDNHWFGSWEDGLYHYDGKTLLHFTVKDGLPHPRIEDIREDELGRLYFNTKEGISRYDGLNFTTLNETGPSDSGWALHPGDLWFKCPRFSGQVLRFDGKSLYRLQLPKTELGEAHSDEQPNAFNPYAVYCIYKDSKGNIWFGTSILGACRYNGKSFDWISEEDVTELHDGPSNGVRSIIEDRNGYFWFNSLYQYEIYGNTLPIKTFYLRKKGIGSLDGEENGGLHEYLSIAKDDHNDLWIATYTSGVWRYDGNNITHFPVRDEGKDISLFSIYKDNQGTLWLGTHSNGAFKFNGKAFERFRP